MGNVVSVGNGSMVPMVACGISMGRRQPPLRSLLTKNLFTGLTAPRHPYIAQRCKPGENEWRRNDLSDQGIGAISAAAAGMACSVRGSLGRALAHGRLPLLCWDSPDIIWSSDSHDRSWSGTLYITSAGPWARRRSSRLAAACDISFTRVPSSPSVKPLRYLSSCAGSSRENRAWVLRVRSAVELLAEAWFQTGVSNARFSKTPTPCISPPIKAMLALAQNLLRAAPSMSETCCLW